METALNGFRHNTDAWSQDVCSNFHSFLTEFAQKSVIQVNLQIFSFSRRSIKDKFRLFNVSPSSFRFLVVDSDVKVVVVAVGIACYRCDCAALFLALVRLLIENAQQAVKVAISCTLIARRWNDRSAWIHRWCRHDRNRRWCDRRWDSTRNLTLVGLAWNRLLNVVRWWNSSGSDLALL